jgi:hypothetical protein
MKRLHVHVSVEILSTRMGHGEAQIAHAKAGSAAPGAMLQSDCCSASEERSPT